MLDLALLTQKIDNPTITTRNLLHVCLMDDRSRQASAIDDPAYFPVYYHLGKHLQPKHLLEIGFELGIKTACFLSGSPNTESVYAFQRRQSEYYSPRLGVRNVKSVFNKPITTKTGDLNDLRVDRQYGVGILGDRTITEVRPWLDWLWRQVSSEGLIIVDYINENRKKDFSLFCEVKNREPIFLNTRYGMGIITR